MKETNLVIISMAKESAYGNCCPLVNYKVWARKNQE